MYFKWSKRTFWNPGQLTLVVDWTNAKFSGNNFCDFVKMLGKFIAFLMTKETPTLTVLKKYENTNGLKNKRLDTGR